jgi:hypothetical protein
MVRSNQQGQARVTAVLCLIGLIVSGVWIWKRLSPDTQDEIVERVIPLTALSMLAAIVIVMVVLRMRRRREVHRHRDRLLAHFDRASSIEKRRDLVFEIIELNGYRLDGLERVQAAMTDVLITTLKTALDDKQHRIRGMAASHLGVLQNQASVPVLLKALEDDHAYVRSSAALALGRMRAAEAKSRLEQLMKDDWDQTVRSRAREALERIR